MGKLSDPPGKAGVSAILVSFPDTAIRLNGKLVNGIDELTPPPPSPDMSPIIRDHYGQDISAAGNDGSPQSRDFYPDGRPAQRQPERKIITELISILYYSIILYYTAVI